MESILQFSLLLFYRMPIRRDNYYHDDNGKFQLNETMISAGIEAVQFDNRSGIDSHSRHLPHTDRSPTIKYIAAASETK